MYESLVGFCYGLKFFINEDIVVLVFGIIIDYICKYDLDLVCEVVGD